MKTEPQRPRRNTADAGGDTPSTGERTRRAPRSTGGRALRFKGLAVAPGIAIGPAYIVDTGAVQSPEYALKAKDVAAECERFTACIARSQRQIAALMGKAKTLPAETRDEVVNLLDTHRQMLKNSRLVRGVSDRIARTRINAEAAVQAEVDDLVERFHAMDDPYLAARGQEIRELGNRLLRNLAASEHPLEVGVPAGAIVIAAELTPADTALLDPNAVAGIVAETGGVEGHSAIMARAMELPTVLGVEAICGIVRAGTTVIVDGDNGVVIVEPARRQIVAAQARRRVERQDRRRLARLRNLPAETSDGAAVRLYANLELPRELELATANGSEGVGLLRTEFMFMNRSDLPGEDEQFRQLARFVRAFGRRPVTIRTLDLGGDKTALALSDRLVPGPNPALGLRALRLSLRTPEILDTQLAAILRASALGTVRILLPMATSASEVRTVRRRIPRIADRLADRGLAIADPLPPVGIMVEVPGAALAADALAEVCDFFAIGTNDLTMYTLAIDRADEQVAHLYNPLHPAVLRLIEMTVRAGERAGIPVSVCGEVAGDPEIVPLLLGLGVRELSMTANALPRVKERIRRITVGAASELAEAVLRQGDAARVTRLLRTFNAATP